MTVRRVLKMGDPLLFKVAEPVQEFDSQELHALIGDMFDTMAALNGAGLAAPGDLRAGPFLPEFPLHVRPVCDRTVEPVRSRGGARHH